MENVNNKKIELLFSKTAIVKGKHSKYMKALSNKFDSAFTQGVFDRNLDVYLLAPIVGLLYNRKAEEESTQEDTKIFAEQLNYENDRLMFTYRLVVFLADKENTDFNERCNRAFRYDKNMEKRACGDKIFKEYFLGGLEFLYEKLIKESTTNDDYIEHMYEFISDFNDLFMENIESEELLKMCTLAGQ